MTGGIADFVLFRSDMLEASFCACLRSTVPSLIIGFAADREGPSAPLNIEKEPTDADSFSMAALVVRGANSGEWWKLGELLNNAR